MKRFISSLSLVGLLMGASLHYAYAHSGDSYNSPAGTPVIDGVQGALEWDSAVQIPVFTSIPSTLFIMNDGSNLYLALKVPVGAILPADRFEIRFDNGHNGIIEKGEDRITLSGGSIFFDAHFDSAAAGYGTLDTQPDGAGVAANAGGFSFFEISHPLNSGDGDDIAFAPGETLGFCVSYSDNGTNFPSLQFLPNCNSAENEQNLYADLTLSIAPPDTHVVDINVTLDPSQITAADDGTNSGLKWHVAENISPVFFKPGDTITGTVTFNSGDGTALNVSNDNGLYYTMGVSTGNEWFILHLLGTDVPGQITVQSSWIDFHVASGGGIINNPFFSLGTSSAAGVVASYVQNLVDMGNSFSLTGFDYSLTLLNSNGALALDKVDFQFFAENIELVVPSSFIPETPVLTTGIMKTLGANYVLTGKASCDRDEGSPIRHVPDTSTSTDCTGDFSICEEIFNDLEKPLRLKGAPKRKFFACTGTNSCVKMYQYILGTWRIFEVCSDEIIVE